MCLTSPPSYPGPRVLAPPSPPTRGQAATGAAPQTGAREQSAPVSRYGAGGFPAKPLKCFQRPENSPPCAPCPRSGA